MKIRFLLIICLFSFQLINSQKLSQNAEISVLTVGPGNSLNDAFGHNAFRIKDVANGFDLVYGYGEYDFDAPNFYLKFAQGKLNYLLSKTNFNRFYRGYVYQNRTINEQVLNLSATEKQKLFDFLQNNYKPENRRYLYDFFYDNCATKIRDVAQNASEREITFNNIRNFEHKTFRNLIHEHVNRNSWGSFGIDIALGSVIDQPATLNEHMYLPKYIFECFENATLSPSENLVKSTKTLYKKKETNTSENLLFSPLVVLSIISFLILLVTYFDYKKLKRSNWLDVLLFSLTGIIGLLILLLWFATDHSATAQNYNLLWAFPFNSIALFQLFKNPVKIWFVKYLKFLVIMLCLLTLHWIVGIQVYAIGLIPLLIALFIRYMYLIKYFNTVSK
ncbi:lipoprotein N-acyltransferase Lnb domain-containing protein [Ichthyenterobacterium magnum]|uniref:Uncharacterized protein DUF4105 n=1 Tax=Ichthyenterobacterium magnum TaxID=1230530 RepID=A0A420DV12_9FLAO|nr:DUF4105 domain-containing protein [Ichthyenterobacterium magnum]RKE97967.1 uncharacterized protein DUF4105 [Ichthyenterobacterium magnum]